jgi:DNA-binding IclR family transcriptional regulator
VVLRERVIDIQLREYMMRRSKVHPLCLVLENVGFAAKNHMYNYHIKLEDPTLFSQLEDSIRLLITDCLSD